MSRASEWSERIRAARAARPDDFLDPRRGTDKPGPYLGLRVDEKGAIEVRKNEDWVFDLPPTVAREAARWLLDVLGEK